MSASVANDSLLIVHIRIVSLQKNIDNLNTFLTKFAKPVDIICLSETRLNDHKLSYCKLSGYSVFYCNSKTKAGETAIFVAHRLKCFQITTIKLKSNSCEDFWVEIGQDKNEPLIVDCIYRYPSNDLKCFEESYVNIFKSFKSSQKHVILGDFNIHYDKNNNLSSIIDYVNHVQSVGCILLIDKPIRIFESCSSIIDQICTNSAHTTQVTPTII